MEALRTLYSIGNYSSIASSNSQKQQLQSSSVEFESICLIWKSILRSSSGDMTKCTKFLSLQLEVSDLFKQSLLLWSKVFLKPSPKDLMGLKELALKAHESVEMDHIEREQVIVNSIEGLLMINSLNDAFSILKLLKASNLDCQTIFIQILIQLGQIKQAHERLQKMKNIPEWQDDIRFLLIEALLGLYQDDSVDSDSHERARFTVKDSLYSYQELIQVHGSTPLLLCHLAAAYTLLGKFSDSQSTLLQIESELELDCCDLAIKSSIQSNLILSASLLNNSPSSFSTSLQ